MSRSAAQTSRVRVSIRFRPPLPFIPILIGLRAFDLVSSRVWWEAATNNRTYFIFFLLFRWPTLCLKKKKILLQFHSVLFLLSALSALQNNPTGSLQSGKTRHPNNECHRYGINPFDGEFLVLEIWRILPLLQDQLCPGVAEPDRDLSMGLWVK